MSGDAAAGDPSTETGTQDLAMRRLCSAISIHAFATALLLVSCCWVGFPPAVGAEERALARDRAASLIEPDIDRGKLFDAVVESVQAKFFDEAKLKQLDWRAHAEAARASVLSAVSTKEAVHRINALLSELKTSHTWLYTPDDYDYYVILDVVGAGTDGADLVSRRFWGSGPYYPGTGVFTREIEGRHFVDGILEGSSAERAGLEYGDEILSVDGMPYTAIAAFRGKIGTTVELAIRRNSEADPRHIEVSVVPIRPTTAFSAATEASARVIERNGSRVGYVHIWASSESSSLRNALAKFERSNLSSDQLRARGISIGVPVRMNIQPPDALVVDMRGRVGGNIAVAEQFLDQLAKPYWGHWRTFGRPGSSALGAGQSPNFRNHSALLIDQHTRSAAEIMAHGYKRGRFGPVVGTPSAGAVSSGALIVMPGELLLYVAVAGHEFDGHPLEGVGVTPDHRVERPLPYAAGADPVLDAAVDLLSKPQ
jgi:carboxyl-terminal processing protease